MDVEPIGAAPYRATLVYSRQPDLVALVVLGSTVPGLIDLEHQERVVLLEPPGGHDLPRVEEVLVQARLERDERTRQLLRLFPVPSAAQLRHRLSPGQEVPAHEAARFRARLTTLLEAREVLRRAHELGQTWKQANDTLQGQRFGWDSKLFLDAAECFAHLDHVAPGGSEIDEQALMSMLLSIRQAEQPGGSRPVDPALLNVVIGPWQEVLGPIF